MTARAASHSATFFSGVGGPRAAAAVNVSAALRANRGNPRGLLARE